MARQLKSWQELQRIKNNQYYTILPDGSVEFIPGRKQPLLLIPQFTKRKKKHRRHQQYTQKQPWQRYSNDCVDIAYLKWGILTKKERISFSKWLNDHK